MGSRPSAPLTSGRPNKMAPHGCLGWRERRGLGALTRRRSCVLWWKCRPLLLPSARFNTSFLRLMSSGLSDGRDADVHAEAEKQGCWSYAEGCLARLPACTLLLCVCVWRRYGKVRQQA